MNAGEVWVRNSAIVALVFYTLSLLLRIIARGNRQRLKLSRLAWTAGCLVFLLHVGCAFQFTHHWSHAAAYEATAQETFEVVGWNWGGGLYANYAFTGIWLFDTLWWWAAFQNYDRRPRWIDWLVQGFLAFLWFNATVVFGEGAARWLGVAASVLLLIVGADSFRRTAEQEPNDL